MTSSDDDLEALGQLADSENAGRRVYLPFVVNVTGAIAKAQELT